MATYSLAVTGQAAGSLPFAVANRTIDDAYARDGALQGACQTNTPFLCKRPDGSQAWYVYDAERSLPGGPRVLKRV